MDKNEIVGVAVKSIIPVILSVGASTATTSWMMAPGRNVTFVPRHMVAEVACKVDRSNLAIEENRIDPSLVAGSTLPTTESASNGDPEISNDERQLYRETLKQLHATDRAPQSSFPRRVLERLKAQGILKCDSVPAEVGQLAIIRVNALAVLGQSGRYAVERLCTLHIDGHAFPTFALSDADQSTQIHLDDRIELLKERSPLIVEDYRGIQLLYDQRLAGNLAVSGAKLQKLLEKISSSDEEYSVGIECFGVGPAGEIQVGRGTRFKMKSGELASPRASSDEQSASWIGEGLLSARRLVVGVALWMIG